MYYFYEWIYIGNYLDWFLYECYFVENKNYGLCNKINEYFYELN